MVRGESQHAVALSARPGHLGVMDGGFRSYRVQGRELRFDVKGYNGEEKRQRRSRGFGRWESSCTLLVIEECVFSEYGIRLVYTSDFFDSFLSFERG